MDAITWRKARVYVLVTLPVLGLGGIAVIAEQQQQDSSQQPTADPVADAARKAREQKKDAPKPKKVYTNEDLGSGTGTAPAAATPAAPANADAKATPEGQANADNPPTDKSAGTNQNDEAAWRKRFKEARDKLAEAQKELDILQREVQKAQVQYFADPQKALSEQYTRKDLMEKDTKIEAKKQEIAQMKEQIGNLEDDLRKSGGDAGWARE
jgi:DNA repair exonuclease SbcCD ATPase subunit